MAQLSPTARWDTLFLKSDKGLMRLNEGRRNHQVLSRVPQALAACSTDESAHIVQFYEDDSFLLDTLSRFIGAGLRVGESCLVVATKPHLADLEERLRMDVVGCGPRQHPVPVRLTGR